MMGFLNHSVDAAQSTSPAALMQNRRPSLWRSQLWAFADIESVRPPALSLNCGGHGQSASAMPMLRHDQRSTRRAGLLLTNWLAVFPPDETPTAVDQSFMLNVSRLRT
jgi:hypothetical protein